MCFSITSRLFHAVISFYSLQKCTGPIISIGNFLIWSELIAVTRESEILPGKNQPTESMNKVAIDPANYFTQPIRRSRHMYQHAFAVPSATKASRKWSFFCNTIRDWNSLPPDIAAAKSLEIFKSQVTKTH